MTEVENPFEIGREFVKQIPALLGEEREGKKIVQIKSKEFSVVLANEDLSTLTKAVFEYDGESFVKKEIGNFENPDAEQKTWDPISLNA